MSISDSIVGEIGEKLAELGTHVVKQTGKAATDIAHGVVTGQATNKPQQTDQGFVESLYGKSGGQQTTPADLQKKKSAGVPLDTAAQKRLAQVRQNLRVMMTPPKPAKEEAAPYIAGKPGGSEEERLKQMKEIEKKKKELPALPVSAKAGMGTGETHRGVAG